MTIPNCVVLHRVSCASLSYSFPYNGNLDENPAQHVLGLEP
jgi:hypothetical protein